MDVRRAAPAAVLIATVALACGPAGPPGPASTAPDPLAPGTHEIAAADGVPIVYDVRGSGEPTLVFVHGWLCDASFWDGVVPSFEGDHRVVTVDLPGHGRSGRDRDRWTVADLAADLAGVLEGLGLDRTVLVGHSMGGPIALLAAARVPERVLGVVGVDTFQNAEMQFPEDALRGLIASYESDFAGTCARFVDSMFPEGADGALVERVRGRMCGGDPTVGVALMRDFPNWDYRAALRGVGAMPVRAINASTMPTAVEVNRKYSADFDVALVDGVGHFLFLERPAEFDGKLAAALDDIVARTSAR